MAIGPVEYVIIGFPGNQFKGEIIPALADLVESGTVRILDLVFVMKDAEGNITTAEYEDLPGMDDLDGDADGLFNEDDLLDRGGAAGTELLGPAHRRGRTPGRRRWRWPSRRRGRHRRW